MALLHDRGTVYLEVDEWINKTSGRGTLRLFGRTADESGVFERERTGYFGLADYADVLPLLFPWADLSVDEDLYDIHEQTEWDIECGAYDKETDTYLFHSKTFSEWRADKPPLRAYEVAQGEVARWRLEFALNDLGRAFLTIDRHLGAWLRLTC